MFLEIVAIMAFSAFFGALIGRRLTRRDRKHISISLVGNLLASQKDLYLLTMVDDLQKRVRELDSKTDPDTSKLFETIAQTTMALEKLSLDR